jgi:hypothetical protein
LLESGSGVGSLAPFRMLFVLTTYYPAAGEFSASIYLDGAQSCLGMESIMRRCAD